MGNTLGISIYEPAPLPSNEAERIRAVETTGVLGFLADPVLDNIAWHARRAAGTRMAAITVVHRDWQYVIAAAGLLTGPYARRTSFCGHAILGTRPVFSVRNAEVDSRFAGNPSVEDGFLGFYAGALIFGTNKELPLGTLCVFDPQPRRELTNTLTVTLLALAAEATARLQFLISHQAP
jgi:GAF domain-containing protein